MPTSIHIPDKLLKEADKRAMALGISRNRLIVRALERELKAGSDWSPGFFDRTGICIPGYIIGVAPQLWERGVKPQAEAGL